MISGVYIKLSRVSLSLILIPGLFGFVDVTWFNLEAILPILIATSLMASIPFSFLLFLSAIKKHNIAIDELSRKATMIALMSIIIAQVIGIIPSKYIQYLYWLSVMSFCMVFCMSKNWFNLASLLGKKFKLNCSGYAGLYSLLYGGVGLEWFKTNKEQENVSIFLSFFVTLPAVIGFIFPALPVPLLLEEPELSVWMLGYVCWPLVLVFSVFSLSGYWLVRHHENQTDAAWLNYILLIFILAAWLRWIWA